MLQWWGCRLSGNPASSDGLFGKMVYVEMKGRLTDIPLFGRGAHIFTDEIHGLGDKATSRHSPSGMGYDGMGRR
jgi:hypothetical protein